MHRAWAFFIKTRYHYCGAFAPQRLLCGKTKSRIISLTSSKLGIL